MGDWTGSRDARGRPHGRGTLRLSKRARFEGRMVRGERSGLGTLFVDEASSDEEDERLADDGPLDASDKRVRWLAEKVSAGLGCDVDLFASCVANDDERIANLKNAAMMASSIAEIERIKGIMTTEMKVLTN